jgi:hypothetical protein
MALPTEYYPSYYPRVTDQWVWGAGDGPDPNGWQGQANCCLANALCSIKEIHEYKETGSVNKYSIGWIFGNRYSDSPGEEGMYIEDALDKLVSDGVPVYTELPENEYNGYGSWNYPDTYYYYNWIDGNYSIIGAKTLVNDNYSNVINKARVAKISGWNQLSLDPSTADINSIKQHIVDDGAVLFRIEVAQNFRDFGGSAVPSNGVVPSPNYSVGYYHAIVAIGWKVINGKLHWLMHNNWGDWWWGDNGRCYMPYNYSYITDCFAVYDAPNPGPSIPSAPPTINYRIEGGFNLSWGSSAGATSYRVKVVRNYDGYETSFVFYTNSGTISGLQYGVTYSVSVRAENNSGVSSYTTSNPATTAPKTPSIISSYNITSSSFSVQISGMSGNWDYINVALYDGDTFIQTNVINYGYNTTSFIGLSPKKYTVKTRSYFTVNGVELQSINQGILEVTITRWKWSAQALNAFQNGGAITNLTATEWNQFIQNIRDVVYSKSGITPTITNAVSGGTFTASMFNQAKNAIDSINATGIVDKNSGSPVIGNDFIILQDKLNGIN